MSNTIKRLRLTFTMGLLLCLFLPLSQCSRMPNQMIEDKKEPVIYERYVIMEHSNKETIYWPALIFIAPLLMALIGFVVKSRNLPLNLFELIVSMGPIAVVWFHMVTGRLVFGGYLAMFLSVGYIGICIFEIWLWTREWVLQRKGVPDKNDNADQSG